MECEDESMPMMSNMIQSVQENYYDDRHLKQRSLLQAGFSQLEKTKDYIERHYYYQKTPSCSLRYIKTNGFWNDLAHHILNNGLDTLFLSENFIHANTSHMEMLGVLAIMQLPFEAGNHGYKADEGKIEITGASNMIVF